MISEPLRWTRKDLLGSRELSAEEITLVPETADAFKQVGTRDVKKVPALQGKTLINLLGTEHSHAGDNGKHRVCLEGYGYRWYRVGGLDYLLKRTEF